MGVHAQSPGQYQVLPMGIWRNLGVSFSLCELLEIRYGLYPIWGFYLRDPDRAALGDRAAGRFRHLSVLAIRFFHAAADWQFGCFRRGCHQSADCQYPGGVAEVKLSLQYQYP